MTLTIIRVYKSSHASQTPFWSCLIQLTYFALILSSAALNSKLIKQTCSWFSSEYFSASFSNSIQLLYSLFGGAVLPSYQIFLVWCHVPHTIDDLSDHFAGTPWWDGIALQQVFSCFSWVLLHKLNRVKCSHLSFLATENELKCLHSLLIIMDWFLG